MQTLELDVMAGTDIKTACKEAVAKAKKHHIPVHFDFNGQKMIAGPLDSPSALAMQYHEQCQRAAEAYQNSDAGKERKRQDELRVKKQQAAIDMLVAALPGIVGNETALMEWCKQYAEAGDLIGVDCRAGEVRPILLTKWADGAHVGEAPDWIKDSQKRMAEYIVGQVIDMLGRGMSAHPMTITFVERYWDLAQKQ